MPLTGIALSTDDISYTCQAPSTAWHMACIALSTDGLPYSCQAPSTAWHIHQVKVTNLASNATWVFPCNRWLGLQRGSGSNQHDLYPQGHPKCIQTPLTDYQVCG